ncbi:immunoglobulin superfamily member 5 isoform X4 [Epinephelus moara]|uniref:immunoglobulin superfamily member 5 isoform X4 n=1 Tax=Epinephelus moara TaxID=300413 RepID=UPI00214E88A1|nr:immunoglobulin superfamily member 5 isoform X4 [Epinephelus moara]
MNNFSLLVLLLSFWIQVVGAQVKLSPETLTVLRGQEARFTCTATTTKWTVMIWLLNSTAVLTISRDIGVLPFITANVTAKPASASQKDSWVFVLKNTQRHNQGQVTCDLQGIDRKTASLFVQEKGSVKITGDNRLAFKGQSIQFECQAAGWYPQPTLQWHVKDRKGIGMEVRRGDYNISIQESGKSLFTVTSNLSFLAAKSSRVDCLASVSALTTPLNSSVNLTVESSPQETTWFDQSGSGRGPVAETTGGKVNLGYSSEGPTDAAYSGVIMGTRRQEDFVSFPKVPDIVSSSNLSLHSESQAQVCLSEESSKNVRRITTV